jgi:hypothetical protein
MPNKMPEEVLEKFDAWDEYDGQSGWGGGNFKDTIFDIKLAVNNTAIKSPQCTSTYCEEGGEVLQVVRL